jgi:radical SAM superfamily enzyme YgiQ (UPF0313 family)
VRTLEHLPPIRRDLIKRHLYLVPNSIVVSRGCPHVCDFCYKVAFFEGGRGFYTQRVDAALAEIDRLPGRHLYFLDDHLFGDAHFAAALFDGMRGMGRLWQAAGTVQSVLRPRLLEKAVDCGLRSLFVGFETLNPRSLRAHGKMQTLHRDYGAAIRRLHGLGVMVNGSFVFGMDEDDATVFDRTVEWAVGEGIETATFHILTPYPGTALYQRMEAEGRLLHRDWDLYDTRHVVYRTNGMTAEELESGYWRAYRDFYRWGSIFRGAWTKDTLKGRLRHAAYAGGWKKFEPLWDLVIRTRRLPPAARARERPLGVRQNSSPPRHSVRIGTHARTLPPNRGLGRGRHLHDTSWPRRPAPPLARRPPPRGAEARGRGGSRDDAGPDPADDRHGLQLRRAGLPGGRDLPLPRRHPARERFPGS